MNREEILAKSRKENEISDERNHLIKMQGANFSVGVLVFLWIVMTKFVPLNMLLASIALVLISLSCLMVQI